MKERNRNVLITVCLGLGIVVAVLSTLAFYLLGASGNGFDLSEFGFSGLILIIVLGTAVIFLWRLKDVRKGLPVKDELSQRVERKAGYYAFLVAIWTAVGAGWFSEPLGLAPGQATGIVVLVSGVVFIGLYLLFSKRGVAR